MSAVAVGQLPCPSCQQPNAVNAEYCWACHYDLKPDAPMAAVVAAPVAAPVTGVDDQPLSAARARVMRNHAADVAVRGQEDELLDPGKPSLGVAMVLTVVSAAIVYGTWWLAQQKTVPLPIGVFVSIWFVALVITYAIKRWAPKPSSDAGDYYSINPFQFRDDIHRRLLWLHIMAFVPGIVLTTLLAWRDLISPRKLA